MGKGNNNGALKVLGSVVIVAGAAAVVSCGGDGGDADPVPPPTAVATVIDTASVTRAVADFGNTVAICQDGSSGMVTTSRAVVGISASIQRGMSALQRRWVAETTQRALALSSTPPADQLGSCGGRYGYRNYSHVNGITTATLAFENYCQGGDNPGETVTTNGQIAFVNTATPSPSGPITTRLEANTSSPVSAVRRNAAGTAINSDTLSFTGFSMVVGVPGGTPTSAQPDRISLGELTSRNELTGKTYRLSSVALTGFEDAAENSSWTLAGRGYRSDGSFYDIATPQPIVQNSDGATVSGQMTFTGANGSAAVATVFPGPTLQVKLTVNGVPFTAVPACVR
jgi:hypothetical protein